MSMIIQGVMLKPEELTKLQTDGSTAAEILFTERPRIDTLYLDVYWDLIHFILTGAKTPDPENPLSQAIFGKELIDYDLDYGPPAYLMVDDVRIVHDALTAISADELRARIDASAISQAGLYGVSDDLESSDDMPQSVFESTAPYFKALQVFYERAALAAQPVVVWLS